MALLKVVENRFFRIFKLKILTKSKMFIFFRNAYSLFRVERKILLQIDISNFMHSIDHVVYQQCGGFRPKYQASKTILDPKFSNS